ncbi:hypothetical protein PAXRUDRAFT_79855, partial [Paxillus rubicundulus Ve08.2h10]
MSTSFAWVWAPTLIGYSVALASYGATIGQVIYYARAFPSDRRLLKILVRAALLRIFFGMFDSAHTVLGTSSLYTTVIQCRRNTSMSCLLNVPRQFMKAGILMVFVVTFMVQAFYAQRVWIISGRNRVITFVVVWHLTCSRTRTPTFEALSTSRYQAWSAFASAACDAMITSSVFYYLRPGRTGFIR